MKTKYKVEIEIETNGVSWSDSQVRHYIKNKLEENNRPEKITKIRVKKENV